MVCNRSDPGLSFSLFLPSSSQSPTSLLLCFRDKWDTDIEEIDAHHRQFFSRENEDDQEREREGERESNLSPSKKVEPKVQFITRSDTNHIGLAGWNVNKDWSTKVSSIFRFRLSAPESFFFFSSFSSPSWLHLFDHDSWLGWSKNWRALEKWC